MPDEASKGEALDVEAVMTESAKQTRLVRDEALTREAEDV